MRNHFFFTLALALVFGAAAMGAFLFVFFTQDKAFSRAVKRPVGPEISPMGAIARGDVPRPWFEDFSKRAFGLRPAPFAPLGLQGLDRIVHSLTAAGFQSETAIAVNGDYIVVGFNDIRGFGSTVSVSGYAYSSDGGNTWIDGGQLPLADGTDKVYGDPDVKTWTDPQTQEIYFFYSSIYITSAGLYSLCLHVSMDYGATWSSPREVTTITSPSDFADKPFMCVDAETGRVIISWTNFSTSTSMRVVYSDNKGLSWSSPITFASRSQDGQGSIPRTDPASDNVYIAWRSYPSSGAISFVKSVNNGASWSSPVDIATGVYDPEMPYGSDRIHSFPSMDVDGSTGNIYIVYASQNLGDFSDVYFVRSTNLGTSFSSPASINSNPGSDRAQFFPWVSVDQSDGRIDAIWYDQISGNGPSDITEVLHTHSTDEGLTWACPTPLTDKPFHAEYGNDTSQPNIGDYNQCVSQAGKLFTVFAKTDEPSYSTYAPDTYFDLSDMITQAASLAFSDVSIVDTGCNSNNGYLEVKEDGELTVTIIGYSTCASYIGSIQGTLTSSTPAVSIVDGSAVFGDINSVGGTSTNLDPLIIHLDAGFPCGDNVDLLLTLNSSEGTAQVPFQISTGVPNDTILLSEDFDGVTAPSLPAGWTTTNESGINNPWKTSTTYSSTAPNAAFCADISGVSLNRLTSPAITVPVNCDLLDVTFDITHNLELDVGRSAWDGALLKVRINGSQTVLAGAFPSLFEPFYPWQLLRMSGSSANPLQDLSCWSSDVTPDFSQVHLQFPGLAGATVEFLWDLGTDGWVGTSSGMFVDNVVVKSIDLQCPDCADVGIVALNPPSVVFDNAIAYQTTCDTVQIINIGTGTVNIQSIAGCDTAPFSVDTSMTAHTIQPGDSTMIVVCVTPTGSGGDTCLVTIASDASNSPSVLPVSLGIVTAAVSAQAPGPFRLLGVVPNPFNPSARIQFFLPAGVPVTAEVWSVGGERVRVLARNRRFDPGQNELHWDGKDQSGKPVASGVYFIRLRTPLGEMTARAVLLK